MQNISDIYIKSETEPNYNEFILENNTFIDVVVSKLQMILFTNKGDVLGDPEFGADIPTYLWKTRFPSSDIKSEIIDQINTYIPELSPDQYNVNVYILQGSVQDIGIIQIDLGISNLTVLFK